MKYPLSILILASFSLPAYAETQLHPIVTASRIAQSADQTMSSVSVITRAEISSSQNQSTVELLRERIPGLDFLTTGGPGHQVSTFLRGTSSDQFLLMVDGNIIGSATTGSAALELIPLDNIERIEVLRGPRSSLYGSEAIGGVIQIFTRASDTTSVSLTTGSQHTSAVTAATQLGSDNTTLNIAVNHYQTRGFNVTNDSEPDADGYINDSINLRLKHALSDTTRVFANTLYADGNTEFDNDTYGNESDSIQQNVQLGFDTDITSHWNTRFDIGQSKDELVTNRNNRDFFTPSIINKESTLFTTKRDQAHWQNQLFFTDSAQSSFGLDFINDKVEGTTAYSEHQRSNSAAYGLVQDSFGRHQLQAAARLDDNEAFGQHATGSLAWGYDLSGNQRLRLSHGTAFIAPSFNDLYFVDPFFSGNPNLDPETSRTSELAFSTNLGWGSWELIAYRTLIKNLIVLNDSFTSVENSASAKIIGYESDLNIISDAWTLNFNLALIDPIDQSTDKVLQNRARQTLKLSATRHYESVEFGGSLLAQDSRFANASNSIELPGYAIINLTAAKSFDKHWQLKARLENLLDKEYTTSVDFFQNTSNNTPISLFVTLHYQQ